MAKDTKRYCRIQIGYLLKKLCKRFTADELIKFVPGDDEVTHRRLKKIRKQMRRESRQQLNQKDKNDDEESEDEFVAGLEKKSVTYVIVVVVTLMIPKHIYVCICICSIDDILADSDSDLPEDMDTDDDVGAKAEKKNKKRGSTFIREDPEDIVDLADIKSVGNVLSACAIFAYIRYVFVCNAFTFFLTTANRPDESANAAGSTKTKNKDPNRGFKTAEDGRLIISDKALRGVGGDDSNSDGSDDDEDDEDEGVEVKKAPKRGMEMDSSDGWFT